MPLIEVPIPNLLGGVSNQPPANRQPGQLSDCINAILHPVNGLAKRRGTRHLAKLIDGVESAHHAHFIDRDPTERYLLLLGERRLRVFSALDGREYPVKINNGATNAGRGLVGTGTPLNYLNPRRPEGDVLASDEDFVIGGGNWLSDVGNTVTSYVAGRGPFDFGRVESTATVNADTVAEVGNGAAASISDAYQVIGQFSRLNVAVVYLKESPNFTCNDVELALVDTTNTVTHSARFDLIAGVFSVGAVTAGVEATAELVQDGWYRCTIKVDADLVPTTDPTDVRRYRLRWHTNAATPANKRTLVFGARLYDDVEEAADYVFENPFRVLTITDTSFLLNTEVTPLMVAGGSGTITNTNKAAYVWVRSSPGVADVTYKVVVKFTTAGGTPDTFTATFTTTAALHRTDEDIAASLATQLNGDPDLIADRINGSSVIRIRHQNPGTDTLTSVTTSDSRGDQSMVAMSFTEGHTNEPSVAKFTDLPLVFLDGQVVRVTGDVTAGVDDYWVEFTTDDPSGTGTGVWVETHQPTTQRDLDATTIPARLSRRQDDATGSITGIPNSIYFAYNTGSVAPFWDQRLVGDAFTSNPDPHFVGRKIRDIFLTKGRLGFLAEDHVSLSEAGEILNFFRTTVLDLVDTDPIDVASGSREVVDFRHATPTSDTLLVFSDREQFQLLGDPQLTPATAQLAPVRAFKNLANVAPASSARGVLFPTVAGGFSGLTEVTLLGDAVSFKFEDLAAQAPRYITGEVQQLAHSSLTGLTALRGAPGNQLFLHQTFLDDQENRLQSALHRWTFNDDLVIRGMRVLDTDLRLAAERDEGWFLESLLTDTEQLENGRPIVLLDRRVDEAQVTRVYSGAQDETEITLPYELSPTATYQVVDAASGLLVPVIAQTVNSVTVAGDMSSSPLYVGERYDMEVTLSEPVIADQGPRGGLIPRMGRPIDVHRLALYLADSAFLEVRVERDLRTPTSEEFSAAGLGTGLLGMGQLNTYTGDAVFAIIGLSTEVTVVLLNTTPFPSYVQSGRWEVLNRARAGLV